MTAQVIDMLAAIESRRVAIASSLQFNNDVNRDKAAQSQLDRFVKAEAEQRKDEAFFASYGVPRAGLDIPPHVWPEFVPMPWAVRNLRAAR